jgi:hypothetical protein
MHARVITHNDNHTMTHIVAHISLHILLHIIVATIKRRIHDLLEICLTRVVSFFFLF